jgi:uncharacterized protein
MIGKIDNYAGILRRGLDVDFVVVITTSRNGYSAEELTGKLMQGWQIGKGTRGDRGLLLLLCLQEQEIRMEVGYDLEHIYTDNYVSLVQNRLMKEFFEQNEVERGFYATIEHIVERGLNKDQYVAESPERPGSSEYFSGGAGAKARFQFGAMLNKPKKELAQELKAYFGAQPTPEEAFVKYVEFGYHNLSDYEVDLFSPLSKEFFRHWPTTSLQRKSEAEHMMNEPYLVRKKGRHAAVIFPCNDDPARMREFNPYFFVKGAQGWQADMNAMARSIMMTGYNHWFFISTLHPYMFAFEDYLIDNNTHMFKKNGQKAYLGILYNRRKRDDRGLVVFPATNSPAEKAGIRKNDILIAIDGETITRPYQDWAMMKRHKPGDVVKVMLIRNNTEMTIPVVVSRPENPRHGHVARALSGKERPWLGLFFGYSLPFERKVTQSYVSILEVAPGSPAEKAGLKPNDYVIRIEGMRGRFPTLWDVVKLLNELQPGDDIEFVVLRNLKRTLRTTVVTEKTTVDGFY